MDANTSGMEQKNILGKEHGNALRWNFLGRGPKQMVGYELRGKPSAKVDMSRYSFVTLHIELI